MRSTEVPNDLLFQVLSTAATHEGRLTYEGLCIDGVPAAPPDLVHPGDPFGKILAFAWGLGESRAVSVMADYMSGLRHSAALAHAGAPRLEAVLRALPQALPDAVDADEARRIVDALRVDTPGLYGDPAL